MAVPALAHRMTAEEFLVFEEASSERHEFVDGEVFGMSGASEAHNLIVGNIFLALRQHLPEGPCRALLLDMKLRVDAVDAFFYPDLFVTCDERDHADPLVKRHPKLIVEVLSESTAEFDRVGKFERYRRIASLREYVLVDSRERRVELFRKNDAGAWEIGPVVVGDGEASFASVGLTMTMEAIYFRSGVALEAARRANG